MSDVNQSRSHGDSRPRQRRFGRPRIATALAFAGGIAVAAVLLPAGITAATSNPPLNVLVSDPDDNSQHAKVDATGALKVSSTGTSTVSGSITVANTPLPVTGTVDVGSLPAMIEVTTRPASKFFHHFFDVGNHELAKVSFPEPIDMSLITFPSGNDDELDVFFLLGDSDRFQVGENESLPKFVALTQPIRADSVQVLCENEFESCKFTVDVVGS